MVEHKPFSKIVTRYGNSSLEVPFLRALIETGNIGENLGFASKVAWEFRSTAQLRKPTVADRAELQRKFEDGIVHFNVGGGAFDQHGRTEPAGLCETCSLDLLRGEYDFLKRRPWLRDIYRAVRENDLHGTAVSSEPQTIRHLMAGLDLLMPGEHEWQLAKMSLAFRAAFARCKADVPVDKALGLKEIGQGVAAVEPDKSTNFSALFKKSEKLLDNDWRQARQDLTNAVKAGKVTTVWHPQLSPIIGGYKLRVIELRSDAVQATKATRWAGFDKQLGQQMWPYEVCVVLRSAGVDGHVQIQFNDKKEFTKDSKTGKPQVVARWRLDLAPVAKALRLAESNLTGRRLEHGVDWSSRGFIYDVNGDAIPWFAAEFATAIFNGTSSSPDVPVTKIRHDKIMASVTEALPLCRLLKEQSDGTWQPEAA